MKANAFIEYSVVGPFGFSHSAFALDSGSGFAYGKMGLCLLLESGGIVTGTFAQHRDSHQTSWTSSVGGSYLCLS
jgi:hypothetical protein